MTHTGIWQSCVLWPQLHIATSMCYSNRKLPWVLIQSHCQSNWNHIIILRKAENGLDLNINEFNSCKNTLLNVDTPNHYGAEQTTHVDVMTCLCKYLRFPQSVRECLVKSGFILKICINYWPQSFYITSMRPSLGSHLTWHEQNTFMKYLCIIFVSHFLVYATLFLFREDFMLHAKLVQ